MQRELDSYICPISFHPYVCEACLIESCLVIWAALSHCSYTSLISCKYASSIHVACLKVPHFKEPTQHSSVQICTPEPVKDGKNKTQRLSMEGELLMSLIIQPNLSFPDSLFWFCFCGPFIFFPAWVVCLCHWRQRGRRRVALRLIKPCSFLGNVAKEILLYKICFCCISFV